MGRPRSPDPTIIVSIRMPKSLARELAQLAKLEGTTRSRIVTELGEARVKKSRAVLKQMSKGVFA